jgi:LPPG:FO 2-phospho-L-lactate transferase
MKITALAGGTGAVKLLRALYQIIPAQDLTVIANTGDDLQLWGLSISPDVDTITYALAGLLDEAKGWGVQGDTFSCRAMMGKLGEPTFFALGDRDLALHVHRTSLLRSGDPLSRVTERVCHSLGIKARVLPMSDDPVRTRVQTPTGWLAFQEFFVRDRCEPEVLDVDYEGAGSAKPGPGVIEAITSADRIIICPSNPISSIGPILAIPAIERALIDTPARVLAVSPIIGSTPVSGPAGKMMVARGYDLSATGVAAVYSKWLDVMVIDDSDADQADDLRPIGIVPVITETLMTNREREIALAKTIVRALS